MANTLYDDLKDVLNDLKTFLDANVPTIKPAVQALKELVPIVDLIDKLIALMNTLKTEIQSLDVGAIPGLSEAASFTEKVTAFINAAKPLLPDNSAELNSVLDAASVVTGLPSVDTVKADIISLIDAIVGHLTNLKS